MVLLSKNIEWHISWDNYNITFSILMTGMFFHIKDQVPWQSYKYRVRGKPSFQNLFRVTKTSWIKEGSGKNSQALQSVVQH